VSQEPAETLPNTGTRAKKNPPPVVDTPMALVDSDDESIASGLTSEGSKTSPTPPPSLKPAPAPSEDPPWPSPEEDAAEPEPVESGETFLHGL